MYMYLLGPFNVDPIISHATIGRLCTKPASYWSNRISVITFCKYENNKNTKPKSRHFRQFRNPGWEKNEDLWWPCYIFIVQYDGENGWAIDWAIKGLLKTVAHPRSDGCMCVDCHSGKSLPCSGTHSFPWCWHIHADSHHCWRYIHPHLETECVKALIIPSQNSTFPHTT